MVVLTNEPAQTATVATACRVLGLNFPGNMPLEVTEERIDADPRMQPTLEVLLTRLSKMWVPWAELATPQFVRVGLPVCIRHCKRRFCRHVAVLAASERLLPIGAPPRHVATERQALMPLVPTCNTSAPRRQCARATWAALSGQVAEKSSICRLDWRRAHHNVAQR